MIRLIVEFLAGLGALVIVNAFYRLVTNYIEKYKEKGKASDAYIPIAFFTACVIIFFLVIFEVIKIY